MKIANLNKITSSMQRALCAIMASFMLVLALATPDQTADAAATVTRQDDTLFVETSQGVLIKLDQEAANIFIANPLIADIQIKSPRLFYVFGLLPGSTTIYAVDKNDNIIYGATIEVTQNIARIQETITRLIPSASIKVESLSGIILLTGYAQSPDDAGLAQQLVEEMLVIRVVDGNISQGLIAQKVINRIKISTPTQVNLRVKIAEMSRNTLKTLGFNLEASFLTAGGGSFLGFLSGAKVFNLVEDPENPGSLIKEFITRNDDTNSFFFDNVGGRHDVSGVIDALETEGYLSILAEPNLTAISGETASFLAGGEFPIPVPQAGISQGATSAITIQFKEFGVGLSFTPTVLSENKINLKVAPEVSQLSTVGAVTIGGFTIPALTTRRATTTVELASGQSFAIAGLLQSNISQQARKFPWLGDIPILGTLFRSDTFKREETELVIIVTPYIVRPVNGERLMAPTDINHLPMDTGRYLKGKRDLAGDGGLKTGNQ